MSRVLKFVSLIFVFLHCLKSSEAHEEPCPSLRYGELRMFEKMDEMVTKLQTIVDKLDKQETREPPKATGTQSKLNIYSDSLMVSDLETDGWEMVFRAISGNGQDVYKAWTTGHGTSAEKPSKMERSHSCHYRNSLISNWSNLDIKYVKFAFYDTFREVAYVIFKGKGSSITNWFDKSRVLASSWPDLTSTSTTNVFSLGGYIDLPRLDRRFYISRQHKGCPGDLGHIVVINAAVGSPACLWDNHASYPQFLYSKINSVDFWERRMFGTADFMAVFVK